LRVPAKKTGQVLVRTPRRDARRIPSDFSR
jgi:hypothetical protein